VRCRPAANSRYGIALHQQKANQIGQWDKQAQTYQAWNKEEQTVDMKLLAQGLNTPQIQERLATAFQRSTALRP